MGAKAVLAAVGSGMSRYCRAGAVWGRCGVEQGQCGAETYGAEAVWRSGNVAQGQWRGSVVEGRRAARGSHRKRS